jgi:hypothetical protein
MPWSPVPETTGFAPSGHRNGKPAVPRICCALPLARNCCRPEPAIARFGGLEFGGFAQAGWPASGSGGAAARRRCGDEANLRGISA